MFVHYHNLELINNFPVTPPERAINKIRILDGMFCSWLDRAENYVVILSSTVAIVGTATLITPLVFD